MSDLRLLTSAPLFSRLEFDFVDAQRLTVAGGGAIQRANDVVHADGAQTCSIKIAAVALPTRGTRRGTEKVLVAGIARLVRSFATAVHDHGAAVHGSRQVHQESDLADESQTVGQHRRTLAQAGLTPQILRMADGWIKQRANLNEVEPVAAAFDQLFVPFVRPILVAHGHECPRTGRHDGDLLLDHASVAALIGREEKIGFQGHAPAQSGARTHLGDDVILWWRIPVRIVRPRIVVGVNDLATESPERVNITPTEKMGFGHRGMMFEELRKRRENGNRAPVTFGEFAGHDRAKEIVPETIAEIEQTLRLADAPADTPVVPAPID